MAKLKKGEAYQYTITSSSTTETRVETSKAKAMASCIRDVRAGEDGTVGIVHFQHADELLEAIVKYTKQPGGKVTTEQFPLEAPSS